jgi:hypothetical protein
MQTRKPPLWLIPVALVVVGAPAVFLSRDARVAQNPTPSPSVAGAAQTPARPPQALIDRAIAEISRQTNAPTANVTLVSSAAVEWPDASLGCPEPGKSYLQVISPGYRMVLQAGASVYEFHTTDAPDSPLVRCNATPGATLTP